MSTARIGAQRARPYGLAGISTAPPLPPGWHHSCAFDWCALRPV